MGPSEESGCMGVNLGWELTNFFLGVGFGILGGLVGAFGVPARADG